MTSTGGAGTATSAPSPASLEAGADFSPDRRYRFRLWRRWADGPVLLVVGLNPSTADETENDPTITKLIRMARRWGMAGLEMYNMFPYCATDPRNLVAAAAREPRMQWVATVRDNTFRLMEAASQAIASWEPPERQGAVLAAWGAHGDLMGQAKFTTEALYRGTVGGPASGPQVACLGTTASGQPKHPLYLAEQTVPVPFLGDGGRLCRSSDAE